MTNRYRINQCEYLEFSGEALKVFRAHTQAYGHNESGGILLGCVYPGSHVVVEAATEPGILDKSGLRYFDRSRQRAQGIVEREWTASAGIRIYLGEWHTHTEMHPVPSSRDRRMIRNMRRQTKMEIDFLFLVVVGTHSNWVGVETGEQLHRLEAAQAEEDDTISRSLV